MRELSRVLRAPSRRPSGQAVRPEALCHTLVLRVVALSRSDHTPISLLRHSIRAQRRQVALLVRLWVVIVGALCLISEGDARIVSRRHDFRFHREKGDHPVKVEVLRRRLFHLLASAVKKAFNCKYFGAVHVQGFADAHEAVFSNWQTQLQLLDCFVRLLGY